MNKGRAGVRRRWKALGLVGCLLGRLSGGHVAAAEHFAADANLRLGEAFHAFDHLGNIGHQAEAAAAGGATVLYAGFGGIGYGGLPERGQLEELLRSETEYVRTARRAGIRVALGYVCATSIVGLDAFDRYWTPEMRARFQSPPSDWRQQDRQGRPLRSWYEGRYEPACMSHPDWREYERQMVALHLQAGYDGIFFDNPTVHPQGCYCPHCMRRFAEFLLREGLTLPDRGTEALRVLADRNPQAFARFRCTVARDFLADMRSWARKQKRHALITCNNSLNAPQVLFSQCRSYGYNLAEFSRAQDLVVVEDMGTQPRMLGDGRLMEYGPTYRQVRSLIHGRPLVAVTIADADYHTPPNLMRLAMAEAAAYGATYLAWPTWPEDQRARMIQAARQETDYLRSRKDWLQGGRWRADVLLYLPFRRWVEVERCRASELAAELCRHNIQFEVVSDEDLSDRALRAAPVFLVEQRSVLRTAEAKSVERFERRGGKVVTADHAEWLQELQARMCPPAVRIDVPAVRAVVVDQHQATVVHLLNLAVRKQSSFADVVAPATNIRVRLRVPFRTVHRVTATTADEGTTCGSLAFSCQREGAAMICKFVVPRLEVGMILEVSGVGRRK